MPSNWLIWSNPAKIRYKLKACSILGCSGSPSMNTKPAMWMLPTKQWMRLKKTCLPAIPFLNTYASAMHLWTRNDPASRDQALEQIAKTLTNRPDLSRALYVQGALYYELLDNEKALASLKASLALDEEQPTVWYALAILYDRMENYQESYAACQKVLELSPVTDHAKDLFGVSIHTGFLMEKLAPLIEEVD